MRGLTGFAGIFLAVGCSAPSAPAPSPDRDQTAIVIEPFGPPAPDPPRHALRVLVGGDLIPHRPSLVDPTAPAAALAPLEHLFRGADAVVANFESSTGTLSKKAFRMAYAVPPAWLDTLPSVGITAVTVANNHACDLGTDGISATIAAATKSGLGVVGADEDGDAWAPRTLVELDGKRVCAVAWTTLVNSASGCARSPRLAFAVANAAGRRKIGAALARAHLTCDATIAMIHGGIEYVPQTAEMMGMADEAAELGADAVVIHHPHVASPVIVHPTRDGRHVPVFASVGNLVSNQGESWKTTMFPSMPENRRMVCVNAWTRLGVLADLSFDFRGTPRLDWGFHLLWTDNDHAETKAAVPNIATRILDPEGDATLVSTLGRDARGPLSLFDDRCWLERRLGPNDPAMPPRCGTTLLRKPLRSSPAVARTKTKR